MQIIPMNKLSVIPYVFHKKTAAKSMDISERGKVNLLKKGTRSSRITSKIALIIISSGMYNERLLKFDMFAGYLYSRLNNLNYSIHCRSNHINKWCRIDTTEQNNDG